MLQKELTYIVVMDKLALLIKGKYLVNFYLYLGKYFSEKVATDQVTKDWVFLDKCAMKLPQHCYNTSYSS